MSDPKYKNNQPSHLQRVKCRVCKLELRYKHYGTHLLNVHPEEDSKNLSSLSDQRFSSFFQQNSSKRPRISVDVGVNLDENANQADEERGENDFNIDFDMQMDNGCSHDYLNTSSEVSPCS